MYLKLAAVHFPEVRSVYGGSNTQTLCHHFGTAGRGQASTTNHFAFNQLRINYPIRRHI